MAQDNQGPRLTDDPRVHMPDEKLDSFFGPVLRTTDRPDYFSIRSKLVPALIFITAIILFPILLLIDTTTRGPASTVILILFVLFLFALIRLYMGVVFDFLPDGIHSHIPELFIFHPFYLLFDFFEKKRDQSGNLGIRLRSIDRTRLHEVQIHTIFGWSILLIALDDTRIGWLWWLSAVCHPRKILVLLLNEKDAQKALPLVRNYILFPNA